MGFISKKNIRAFRSFILSPQLENLLLFSYLICFGWIIALKRANMDGSSLSSSISASGISSYQFHQDLKQYFKEADFNGISEIDDIYDYVLFIQNERMWVPPGMRSPNWPIGSLRLTQARVNINNTCIDPRSFRAEPEKTEEDTSTTEDTSTEAPPASDPAETTPPPGGEEDSPQTTPSDLTTPPAPEEAPEEAPAESPEEFPEDPPAEPPTSDESPAPEEPAASDGSATADPEVPSAEEEASGSGETTPGSEEEAASSSGSSSSESSSPGTASGTDPGTETSSTEESTTGSGRRRRRLRRSKKNLRRLLSGEAVEEKSILDTPLMETLQMMEDENLPSECQHIEKNPTDNDKLYNCMKRVYHYDCNPIFSESQNEHGYNDTDPLQSGKPEEVNLQVRRENSLPFEAPEDKSLCAVWNCSEYAYSLDTDTRGFVGKYSNYPGRGYKIDFDSNRRANKEKIEKLRANHWIDENTRAVWFSWTVKQAWSQTYYTFQGNIELPGNGLVVPNPWEQQNLFFYSDGQLKATDSSMNLEIILYSILLIYCLLYLAKILFELSLSISRVTNFLDLVNLGAMFIAVVSKYTDIAMKSNERFEMTNPKEFDNFTFLVGLESIGAFSMTICSFFYPFRFFQYFAHFKFFDPAKGIMNAFARISPGILVLSLCILIGFLSWAMGIYVVLSPFYSEFSTYLSTVYAIIALDFQKIKEVDSIFEGFHHNSALIDLCHIVIFNIKVLTLMFSCALVINLYKKAMPFEKEHYHPNPETVAWEGSLEEMSENIEKLYIQANNQSARGMSQVDVFTNQKIVAWLLNRRKESQSTERQMFFKRLNQELMNDHVYYNGEPRSNFELKAAGEDSHDPASLLSPNLMVDPNDIKLQDHENAGLLAGSDGDQLYSRNTKSKTGGGFPTERSKNVKTDKDDLPRGIHIQPIEFETVFWLEEFLQSLFQLKPGLKTSVTYAKFRIVVEFYSGGIGDKRFDISVVENLIDYLREVGCKVPVLIYCDFQLSTSLYQKVMQLKKKYLMLFFTTQIKEVKRFCKMEHMRDQFAAEL